MDCDERSACILLFEPVTSTDSLLILRKRHTNQNRWFFDIVMRVAHDADGAGLHHHSELKGHGIEKPSLDESTKDVAVGNLSHIRLVMK